ncbi:DUF4186 domain-containing protein [Sutterella sp.]|uniref:DUF4186 domain-containing protein n=1 Tax=Sutterella sp. TaxID=1981025 RepID=UPI0026E041AD|nr:DUF4186 domain-containing protein [Sutterella sp.]MDO5531198.1 DUF4186 domain-containing protein [Sutterella sp.]
MSQQFYLKSLLGRLARSSFRAGFHLSRADIEVIRRKGLATVRRHAREIVAERLAPAEIPNDGRQTPWRGYPVFVAQHACACCCRGCLFKWQGIPKDRALTEAEVESVTALLSAWIEGELRRAGLDPAALEDPAPGGEAGKPVPADDGSGMDSLFE